MRNSKSTITGYTTGQSRYATGQARGCPVTQPGRIEAVPLPNRAICGCPVTIMLCGCPVSTQQDNIRLPHCLTRQDRGHPAQPGSSEAVPRRNWSTIELYCCASKLSCTVSQCHLQETSHLGILRLLHYQYHSTSHLVLEIEAAVEAPNPVA